MDKSTITVDVVEDVLFVAAALRSLPRSRGVVVARAASTWLDYISRPHDVSPLVVVRAELPDHVPAVLKVRALRRMDVGAIVLTDWPSAAFANRLREAGALEVITTSGSFDNLLGALISPRALPLPSVRQAGLSDRELQVACLYAGRTAPSANLLAGLLGIPLASVRTHLHRARRLVVPHSEKADRAALRAGLIEAGWMPPRL